MFIVLLKYTGNRDKAGPFVEGHVAWLKQGIKQGAFLAAGTLDKLGDRVGGAIIAARVDRAELEARVAEDPFVAEKIVSAEILDWSPSMTDERLSFLAA